MNNFPDFSRPPPPLNPRAGAMYFIQQQVHNQGFVYQPAGGYSSQVPQPMWASAQPPFAMPHHMMPQSNEVAQQQFSTVPQHIMPQSNEVAQQQFSPVPQHIMPQCNEVAQQQFAPMPQHMMPHSNQVALQQFAPVPHEQLMHGQLPQQHFSPAPQQVLQPQQFMLDPYDQHQVPRRTPQTLMWVVQPQVGQQQTHGSYSNPTNEHSSCPSVQMPQMPRAPTWTLRSQTKKANDATVSKSKDLSIGCSDQVEAVDIHKPPGKMQTSGKNQKGAKAKQTTSGNKRSCAHDDSSMSSSEEASEDSEPALRKTKKGKTQKVVNSDDSEGESNLDDPGPSKRSLSLRLVEYAAAKDAKLLSELKEVFQDDGLLKGNKPDAKKPSKALRRKKPQRHQERESSDESNIEDQPSSVTFSEEIGLTQQALAEDNGNIIIISSSDGEDDDKPLNMSSQKEARELSENDESSVTDGEERECILCMEEFNLGISYVGVHQPCGHKRACYHCSLDFYFKFHSCPSCHSKTFHVDSEPF